MELIDQVQGVFREVFDNPKLTITEKTTAADIKEWDSLMHINLIVALEELFEVEFTTEEISEMSCVGDTLKLLQDKLRR